MNEKCIYNSRRNSASSNSPSFLLEVPINIYILFVCIVLYLCNRFFISDTVPFFKNYFNDLLAIPLLFSFSKLWAFGFGIRLDRLLLVCIYVVACTTWELVFPYLVHYGTSDSIDILMYTLGLIIHLETEELYIRLKSYIK